MGEFIAVDEGLLKAVKGFIDENISKCFFMQQGIYDSQGAFYGKIRDGFKYYAYTESGNIEGLVFVNKANVMFPYFIGDEAYRKLDLLKIIKYHNPLIIRGEVTTIEKIFKVIERVMPLHDIKNCFLMGCKNLNHLSFDGVSIIEGANVNFNEAVDFLISAETEFSRNPLSINQLKGKIQNEDGTYYYFLMEKDMVAAQGRIEYVTGNYGLVGGIYTKKSYRGRGYGKAISLHVSRVVNEMNRIPILIVEDDNVSALSVYESLGFEKMEKYRELVLKKI